MYRPASRTPLQNHHHRSRRYQEAWARLLAPLILWICVSVTLRYGYFGTCPMVLGPNSSRLFKATSVFVKQVELRDDAKRGLFLYGFSEKPELSLETNWSLSNYVVLTSFAHKGISLWLNKGSTIRMKWEAETSSFEKIEVSLVKGEQKPKTLLPTSTFFSDAHALNEPTLGRQAEYIIDEDSSFLIRMVNTNPSDIVILMNLNVSSKIYDTTKAKTMCSTKTGSCRLNLLFPSTQFVAVTTPNSSNLGDWSVELSFMARVVIYIAMLGFLVVFILLIMKYLEVCNGDTRQEVQTVREDVTGTQPLIPEKPFSMPHGTGEDDHDGSSSSSEDLYDGNVCIICYDEPRNCFFIPCGHCATCYNCAQRIMDGESKVCPICRRFIHKVRKLLIP